MMTNYQSYETYISYTPILLVIVIVGAQLLPIIRNAEVDRPYPIPVITLGLNAIIFGAIAYCYTYNPGFIGAVPLSLIFVGGFAVVWAVSTLWRFGFFLQLASFWVLVHSQRFSDTRPFWLRLVTDNRSLAIMTMATSVGLLMLMNFGLGDKLLNTYAQKQAFLILIGSAFSGLLVAGLSYHLLSII